MHNDALEKGMNQKQIAERLNISQSTVSRALKNDRRISAEIRKKVHGAAEDIGYHPNAYLTVLMSNIRNGKKITEQGVIGLLIEACSQNEWCQVKTWQSFYQGAVQRGRELGFRVDSFFLKQPRTSSSRIDSVLSARGIKGVIAVPPYSKTCRIKLNWEQYATVAVGYAWNEQRLNRVAYDNLHNFTEAFNQLRRMGYKRIGTVLDEKFICGNRHGIKWYTAYLDCRDSTPENQQIPVCSMNAPSAGESLTESSTQVLKDEFRKWFLKWKPDAVITLVGEQKPWLEDMGCRIPEDVGLACLALPEGSGFSGIDENNTAVGAAAVELVAAQIARNEFGLPAQAKTTMIEGRWVDGTTLNSRN